MDEYEVIFSDQGEPQEQPASEVQHQPQQAAARQPQQEEIPQPEWKPRKASPFADSPYVMQHPHEDVYTAPKKPKVKRKKSGKVWKALLSVVLVVALVAAGCCITAYSVNSFWAVQNNRLIGNINDLKAQIEDLKEQIKENSFTGSGNSVSGSANVNSQGLTPGQVYAKCVNSVVAISATISTVQGTASSSGSGFIISEDGYIVSNYHVVEDAASLTVTTHSGEKYTATVVGYDDNNDFALLKAEADGLSAVTLGSSTDLIVGDQVVAIGNPLGDLSATLTVGYVSGKDRTIATDGSVINMIQTDAAINPGNSGGPMFNMNGEVVGITTAKYSGTTSSGASIEGIGFAIPIDDVKGKITEIQENGYVSTPYMGIEVNNQFDGMGVLVVSVEKGGAAEAAGMKAGDLIVKVGDQETRTLNSLTPAMKAFKVGDTTTITVFRGYEVLELTLTFGEKPHETGQTAAAPEQEAEEETTSDAEDSFQDWWNYFFGDRG